MNARPTALQHKVKFLFVVGEDLRRLFGKFGVLRCGAVRLVGGIVGIEFNHIRHVGVAFALDGIHRQRALFVGNGGLDIVLAHCVILRGFFRLHAEFKNVEYGRGLGGEGNGGDCADKGFFDDVH